MIDWARVAELRDEIGAEDFDEVVEIFLEEVDGVIAELGTQETELEGQMHFLKGSALNLGFQGFADLCQDGEFKAATDASAVDLEAVVASYQASRSDFLEGLQKRFAA